MLNYCPEVMIVSLLIRTDLAEFLNYTVKLGIERIHVWGLDDGVAMCGDVAVALVVGHDEDDVGTAVLGVRGGACAARCEEDE